MSADTSAPPLVKGKDWIIARWLWDEFLRQRIGYCLIAVAFMLVEASMVGAISYLMRPIFDDVLVAGDESRVVFIALAMAAVFVIRGIARFGHKVILFWQANLAVKAAQLKVLRHLYSLDQGFYKRNGPGLLISRTQNDTSAVGDVLSNMLLTVGRDGATVIVLIGVALWTDWLWTLLAMLFVPVVIVPIQMLQRLIRKRSREALQSRAELSKRLDESFHGIQTVQLSGTEAREVSRFATIKRLHIRKALQATVAKTSVPVLLDFGAAIGIGLVLFYGGMQIIAGTHTVGQFMSFFTALGLLIDPLRRLTALSAEWQGKLAALERTYDLVHLAPKVQNLPGPHLPTPARDRATVRFDHVSFSYEAEPVLRDLSFTAPAGKTTALVGPSGAGKTTVFAMLTRLIDPATGQVLINEQDIRKMDLRALRGLFSVVSQDTPLFDDTIRDNILMGAKGVSDTRLQAALAASHVDQFLPLLPQGLDTIAGPRGSALSGGQRQRVAIARALLRDAPILLLDEATSALDTKSEALVQDALDRLSKGRTTLVIAHRLSTIRQADQILVMDQGQIVEYGTHDSLLVEDGTYARLHAMQFRSRQAAPDSGTP